MSQPLPLTGGCQCGSVRYTIARFPKTLYCCHCTECQAQSASAFGMSLRCGAGTVSLSGTTQSLVRDPGRCTPVECVFCPDCGTRLMHRREARSASVSIKAGSLDKPVPFEPVGHIWTASKQNWLDLGSRMLVYTHQPDDDYAALIAAFAERYGP